MRKTGSRFLSQSPSVTQSRNHFRPSLKTAPGDTLELVRMRLVGSRFSRISFASFPEGDRTAELI